MAKNKIGENGERGKKNCTDLFGAHGHVNGAEEEKQSGGAAVLDERRERPQGDLGVALQLVSHQVGVAGDVVADAGAQLDPDGFAGALHRLEQGRRGGGPRRPRHQQKRGEAHDGPHRLSDRPSSSHSTFSHARHTETKAKSETGLCACAVSSVCMATRSARSPLQRCAREIKKNITREKKS